MTTPTFADLGVPKHFTKVLRANGIDTPFPIQAATIPDALAGRDVLGRAPTGSGKTLAFAIPLLANVERGRPHHPKALVLAPTRELADQIKREFSLLAQAAERRMVAIYGGVSYRPQREKLRRGVDVVIATPGRLADLIEQGDISLAEVDHVVVDEADRMADMGFLPEVRRLLDMTAADRQTVLFSATLDGDVATLTRRYQRDPVRHEVGSETPDAGTARHHFWRVGHSDRVGHTAAVVSASESTIVFTRTRRGADRLAGQLSREGVRAIAIHGGRTQRQRNKALKDFAGGRVEALVATDVAARGIHVDGVDAVVHFDPPDDEKAYLHRSGRTGRAGASGSVVSLVLGDQVRDARDLQYRLGLSGTFSDPAVDALDDEGGEQLGDHPVRTTAKPRRGGGKGGHRGGSRGGQHRRARARTSGGRSSQGGSGRGRAGRGGSGRGASRRRSAGR